MGLAPLLALAAMGLWLFRMHLMGDSTFIGDADRLNTFLNIRKFEVDSIQLLGRIPAWNDFMFLGFGTFGLHYMLPAVDAIAYLEALVPISHLFRVSGFVSCGFLVLSGWAAFWFIKDTCMDTFASLVGAGLYPVSAFSIIRISQVDNAFSVLICLPAGLLCLRRIGRGRTVWCLSGLSLIFVYLLLCTFLQEAAYGLILFAAYALYRSWWLRDLRPALVWACSLVVAIIVSLPRLYTVGGDFALLQRSAAGYKLRDFETVYRLLGTRPREWLRWFDDGIFGRFPEEAAALGNAINLHEGFLLYTSTFAALLVVWGVVRFRGEWFRLPRFKDEDAPFHLWFLILVGFVVLAKPGWQTLYVLFLGVDFTHARIVAAALLPFCTLVAILISDLRPSPAAEPPRRARGWMMGLGFLGAAAILLVINGLAHRVGEVTRIPLDVSLGDLAELSLLLLVFGTAPGAFVTNASVISADTWLRAGGLVQVECALLVFTLLVIGVRVARHHPRVSAALTYCLGFLMLLQGIAYADSQLNGNHTRREAPFQSNNLLTAAPDAFRSPSPQALAAFHGHLETNRYRTALVCVPNEFPTFCAPHLSQFWRLRVAEGYMSGVPTRLARLPWPEDVLGPRSLSFPSSEKLPWPILSLLNVKYAVVVNDAFYENRVSDGGGRPREAEPRDVTVLENPLPPVPRQFFAASVEPVANERDAIRLLFSREASRVLALDVQRQSLVEGYPSPAKFSTRGAIRADYRGDRVEVAFESAPEPRFLVLDELYHPDWRAYAGGKELRVYPANAVMRGIVVPPGESRITFSFTPTFRMSWAMLFLAIGGGAWLLAWRVLSRYESRAAQRASRPAPYAIDPPLTILKRQLRKILGRGEPPRDMRAVAQRARERIVAALAAVVGLDIGRESRGYRVALGSVLAGLPQRLAVIVLLLLSLMFLGSVVRFPYYSPITNVEEVALFYTSAGNMAKYGFLSSGFLPDYSTSSRAADHPYIYNHMPPGPDIFIALMLKLSGGSYRLVRLVFWVMFLAGMVCFFRFGALILQRFGVAGAGYAILLISPSMILYRFDDPVYAAFPLLGFLPLLTLQTYYRTGRRWYLAATLAVGLVSAVYLDYLTLLVVSWCWGLLYFTQLLPLRRRHLIAFAAVIVGGLVLHLVQNFLYLGGELFFRELGMTISNRITGLPTKDELKAFYQDHSLVHHGASPLNVIGLIYHLWLAVTFPGGPLLVGAAVVFAGWTAWRNARWEERDGPVAIVVDPQARTVARRFGALWAWVAGTILLPMIMLPAFTHEYGIHGTGLQWYFLAIGVTASILYGVKTTLAKAPRKWGATRADNLSDVIPNAMAALVVLGLLASVVWEVVSYQRGQFLSVAAVYREAKYYKLDEIRRRFNGEVFMTNINPVVVGFFTGGAGHGVCELASLPAEGDIDPSQCHVSYMRDQDHYRTVRPRYFFFFQELFPGFSQCLPAVYYPMLNKGGEECLETMHKRLAARFNRVADTGLFEVFDLASKR